MDKLTEYRADSNNKSLLGVIVGGPLAGAIIVTLSAFLIYKRLCRENTSRSAYSLDFTTHYVRF